MITTGYRYIVKVPGIRSGRAIVEDTRIGVHDVIAFLQTGASVDEALVSYPSLSWAQVLECMAYYKDHKGEIDPLVKQQLAHLDD